VSVAQFKVQKPTDRPEAAGTGHTKPMPLVNTDADLPTFFTRVENLINEKAYSDAIKLLQEIIDRYDAFTERDGTDGRGWISAGVKANELIGQMGPEGLTLYRSLYDAQAQKIYEDGWDQCDTAALQRVSTRYLHSSFGPQALDALGTIYFDTGRFYQAKYCWTQLIQTDPAAPAVASLRAKVAVALHLAGEQAAADKALAELKQASPQAIAKLAGKDQNIAAFVEQVLKDSASVGSVGVNESFKGYPGSATPNGIERMDDDIDVVLAPRWIAPRPASAEDDSENIIGRLLIPKELLTTPNYNQMYGQPNRSTAKAQLRDGHVIVRTPYSPNQPYYGGMPAANRTGDTPLPAMIHPVIVDEKVIYRTANVIEARGLLDGEVMWVSNDMPILRVLSKSTPMGFNQFSRVNDQGRYQLTVGGGKVFALSNFRPFVQPNMGMGFGQNPQQLKDDSLLDTSKLVAINVASGKCVWEIGCGEGDDDVVRAAKFLSAPTYSDGRLYVMALYLENGYHVLCLNAETGSLIWKQSVAQSPAMNQMFGQISVDQFHVGTPPAVVDGMVYALSNTGVLAALDARSGQPMWAYQYESVMESSGAGPGFGNPMQQVQMIRSGNPLVVVRGRVIMMPADSKWVLAVSSTDGTLQWQVDRMNRSDLLGIDEARFAVSGEGLTVLSTADGKEVFDAKDVQGVVGRPAVTQNFILASGAGKVFRLDLGKYSVSTVDLASPDGLLGNLVCSDGKLIAANTAGVCAYFKYELARDNETAKLAKAAPKDKPEILMNRGQLAFNSRRFDEAVADFVAGNDMAREQNNSELSDRIRPLLYRGYVAMGNHAAKSEDMIEQFLKAQKVAATPSEKAQMMLRLAKAYEEAGKSDTAVGCAQDLVEQFPDEEIVDIEVGAKANDTGRFYAKDPVKSATALGRDFIDAVIRKHGRTCYARFDALAADEYKKALTARDATALESIEKRWHNSASAFDAVFSAAEICYESASGASGGDADAKLQQCIRLLLQVAEETGSPKRVSAKVALAQLYSQIGWPNAAAYELMLMRDLADAEPQTEVAFADIKGKLPDLINKIDGGKLPKLPAVIQPVSQIAIPMRDIFTIADSDAIILRDQNYNPIRIGEALAMLQGTRVMLVDTAARDKDQATASWSGLTKADAGQARQRNMSMTANLLGGISEDGTVLAVIDRQSMTGLNIASAKIAWQVERMSDIGLSNVVAMGVGSGRAVLVDQTGKISCVDLAKGKDSPNYWQAQLPAAQQGTLAGTPQIGGGLVAIVSNNTRTLNVYSLSSGKVLAKWESTNPNAGCDALITPGGMLVTLVGGDLAVRELANLDKPLWTRTYNPNSAGRAGVAIPMLLGVSKDHVAVAPDRNGNTVEVMAVDGGKLTDSFVTGNESAGPGAVSVPNSATFRGKDIYVMCAGNWMPQPRVSVQMYNGQGMQNPSLQKFQVGGKGSAIWALKLESEPPFGSILLPPTIGDKQIAVTCKQNINGNPDTPGYTYVVDSESGKVIEKLSVAGRNLPESKTDRTRLMSIGPPVITNGKLCVESLEGVSVYGK